MNIQLLKLSKEIKFCLDIEYFRSTKTYTIVILLFFKQLKTNNKHKNNTNIDK